MQAQPAASADAQRKLDRRARSTKVKASYIKLGAGGVGLYAFDLLAGVPDVESRRVNAPSLLFFYDLKEKVNLTRMRRYADTGTEGSLLSSDVCQRVACRSRHAVMSCRALTRLAVHASCATLRPESASRPRYFACLTRQLCGRAIPRPPAQSAAASL